MRGCLRGALLALVAAGAALPAFAEVGELTVEIESPVAGRVFGNHESEVEVIGGASIFGGVRHLDLFLVLDTSKSLQRTDRSNHRTAGAITLVRNLPAESDIQLGVVDVDSDAEVLAPLTKDRNAVVSALRKLDQQGSTDLAEGIRAALAGFEGRARPGSSRVILLFTDGRSDEEDALDAMREAKRRGVAIHTLLLGGSNKGVTLLTAIAEGTGGSFIRVKRPKELPQAFLDLRTTGVDRVMLRVNDSQPIPTRFFAGRFAARVPLDPGRNRIVATATSLDGRTRDTETHVMVSGPLHVAIDDPLDGTVLTGKESELRVEGSASTFALMTDELAQKHPDHGIEQVVLHVDESLGYPTRLVDGRFEGVVPVKPGENRILATATSRDGRVADAVVSVTVRRPGCSALSVRALRDGMPALSVSDRAIEIVVDASGSMWGQIDGRSKMSIAQEILTGSLGSLPADLQVALRAYGHQYQREQRNCQDSQLLVGFGPDSRGRIAGAIAGFKPRGQTPLAYSLQQVASDFGGFAGEKAVVLVTDGIESCGGDPVAAARALQLNGRVPVHVIGFGLPGGAGEDPASLRAIADASGGRYLAARNADELRQALTVTVGTAFRVSRGGSIVARGALGSASSMRLPAGEYVVHLDSQPPRQIPLTLTAEENLTLVLERRGTQLSQRLDRVAANWMACEEAVPASPR